MDVYADILFLVNGGMDALCLVLTARLLHRPLTMGRLCLAAVLGGLYGVLALFLEVGTWGALLIDMAVCLFMSCVAFGWAKLWLTGGVYLLTSMVMGGVMTALYHWLNRAGVAELLPGGEEGVSSVAFVLLAAFGGLFTLLWGRVFRKSEGCRASRVSVSVTLGTQTVTFGGMIDSGNLLTDPLSGTPVIVVKQEKLLPLLSEELGELLRISPLPVERMSELPEGERIRLIPTVTATGQGMLVAIRPDAVSLTVEEGQHRAVTVRALICPIPLAEPDREALVPSELLL